MTTTEQPVRFRMGFYRPLPQHHLERFIATQVHPLILEVEGEQWRFLLGGEVLLSFIPATGEWYAPLFESSGIVERTSDVANVAKLVKEVVQQCQIRQS